MQKVTLHAPVVEWSTREKLVLASSVTRSGDQNWVSVSRAVKPLLDDGSRPSDYYSQKSCASQYALMLEKVATPKRKRGHDAASGDTPGEQIVRHLTYERMEELKKQIRADHAAYHRLRQEANMTRNLEDREELVRLYSDMKMRQLNERRQAEKVRLEEEQAARQGAAARLRTLSRSSSVVHTPLPSPLPTPSSSLPASPAQFAERSLSQTMDGGVLPVRTPTGTMLSSASPAGAIRGEADDKRVSRPSTPDARSALEASQRVGTPDGSLGQVASRLYSSAVQRGRHPGDLHFRPVSESGSETPKMPSSGRSSPIAAELIAGDWSRAVSPVRGVAALARQGLLASNLEQHAAQLVAPMFITPARTDATVSLPASAAAVTTVSTTTTAVTSAVPPIMSNIDVVCTTYLQRSEQECSLLLCGHTYLQGVPSTMELTAESDQEEGTSVFEDDEAMDVTTAEEETLAVAQPAAAVVSNTFAIPGPVGPKISTSSLASTQSPPSVKAEETRAVTSSPAKVPSHTPSISVSPQPVEECSLLPSPSVSPRDESRQVPVAAASKSPLPPDQSSGVPPAVVIHGSSPIQQSPKTPLRQDGWSAPLSPTLGLSSSNVSTSPVAGSVNANDGKQSAIPTADSLLSSEDQASAGSEPSPHLSVSPASPQLQGQSTSSPTPLSTQPSSSPVRLTLASVGSDHFSAALSPTKSPAVPSTSPSPLPDSPGELESRDNDNNSASPTMQLPADAASVSPDKISVASTGRVSVASPGKPPAASPSLVPITSPTKPPAASPNVVLISSPGKDQVASPCMASDASPARSPVTSPGMAPITSPVAPVASPGGMAPVFSPQKVPVTSLGNTSATSPGKTSFTSPGKSSVASPVETSAAPLAKTPSPSAKTPSPLPLSSQDAVKSPPKSPLQPLLDTRRSPVISLRKPLARSPSSERPKRLPSPVVIKPADSELLSPARAEIRLPLTHKRAESAQTIKCADDGSDVESAEEVDEEIVVGKRRMRPTRSLRKKVRNSSSRSRSRSRRSSSRKSFSLPVASDEDGQDTFLDDLTSEPVRTPADVPAAEPVVEGTLKLAAVQDSETETADDQSVKESHASSDEGEDDEDTLSSHQQSVISSAPSTPGTIPGDDELIAAQRRTWKKSIMLVWKEAASHRYASLFLHPVTEHEAPGYSNVVLRPMDLATIKKNIEIGAITTTEEFHRDILLMFQNAVMYNRADHDVYQMAVEMRRDVSEYIQAYTQTQMLMQSSDSKESKYLRGHRDARRSGVSLLGADSMSDDDVLPGRHSRRVSGDTDASPCKKKRISQQT